jgi:hypothetical protein
MSHRTPLMGIDHPHCENGGSVGGRLIRLLLPRVDTANFFYDLIYTIHDFIDFGLEFQIIGVFHNTHPFSICFLPGVFLP